MNKQVMFSPEELTDIRICIDVAMGSLDKRIKKTKDPIIRMGFIDRLNRYEQILDKIRGK